MARIPESIAIIGAGAIGCEFGYFYGSFGAQVTIIEMLDHLLPIEDEEVSKELERSFKKQKIGFRLSCKVTKVSKTKKGVLVTIEGPKGKKEVIEVETVLVATGVRGNVERLGLEELGVAVEKDHIKVDRWYQTSVGGIYAIGDVIGAPWLAHVASHEGIVCVEKIAGKEPRPVDYGTIPSCTYCQPQVASVGLTEAQAKEAGYDVRVGRFPFRVLGKARASQTLDGFVKLIFDAEIGELLGAHIVGEEATEMIAELVTAKALESTYIELLKTVHAHPTLSEGVMEAAGAAFGEQIHL
jgi:dihydrolipoamide dehydrogenase